MIELGILKLKLSIITQMSKITGIALCIMISSKINESTSHEEIEHSNLKDVPEKIKLETLKKMS